MSSISTRSRCRHQHCAVRTHQPLRWPSGGIDKSSPRCTAAHECQPRRHRTVRGTAFAAIVSPSISVSYEYRITCVYLFCCYCCWASATTAREIIREYISSRHSTRSCACITDTYAVSYPLRARAHTLSDNAHAYRRVVRMRNNSSRIGHRSHTTWKEPSGPEAHGTVWTRVYFSTYSQGQLCSHRLYE
jgi:hypothetical protein